MKDEPIGPQAKASTIQTLATSFGIGAMSSMGAGTITGWQFIGKIDYIHWNGVVNDTGIDDTPIPPQ